MRRYLLTALYVFLSLTLIRTAYADTSSRSFVVKKPDQKLALIIGNGGYKTAPLKNPVKDAQDIAQTLERVGFNVTLKKNQSQSEMRGAIREFGRKIRKGGIGLFYYAGHGMQINGENFLIPVGNDIQEEDEIPDQAIKLSLVLNKMDTAKNKMNVVILDACRDNPFARSFRSASKGLALVDGPTGTFIAYSTQPGATASDGDASNGLYTKHLLNNILIPGLTIEQVFKRVRTQVMKDSGKKQVPWELSSLIGEDFYFLGQGSQPASVSAPIQQVAMLEPTEYLNSDVVSDEGIHQKFSYNETVFSPLIAGSQNNSLDPGSTNSFDSTTEEITISFDFNKLPIGTLIKGIWSDDGRSTNLQEMFLVSSKENDHMSFKLNKPLGGFTQGSYTFNIYLEDNNVGSIDFKIMK